MPETSLLSLVLTLRPLHPLADVPSLGRASHALLLNAVRWADPALAEQLHAGSETRPFTASDVIGVSRKAGLSPDRTYPLRFTALTAPVAQALLKTLTPALSRDETTVTGEGAGPLSPGSTIELGSARFRVEALDSGEPATQNQKSEIQNLKSEVHHPWAWATNYEDLSAPWLLGRVTPPRLVTLEFVSPTTFKSEGRHVPVPLPHLVFGSLLEKWNVFAPVTFPPELRRYATECLALSSYQLHSRGVMLKEGGLRMGAMGRARYVTTNFDRYWMSLINLLADFAIFAGLGAGTGMGLGQCRRSKDVK
ncbi:CRISPR-associated endoribonuclease Cas6 [Anaerolineae bacterium]|nr:CRISPR-associated endoribonuclease Cas6 [Anaerolineae bacterium]